MKAVMFMKELGIKMKRIAELLPIPRSTIYKKLRAKGECLNLNLFRNLEGAKEVIENYIGFYNNERPHSSLNYKAPIEFEIEQF